MTEEAKSEKTKKRKGIPMLAIMDENCTSCAGAPLCDAHCPIEDCINLLYEEMPRGGLKPYRVWVDNDKCIGCQMCYSDDLTKIHQHKETGDIFYEYGGKFFDEEKNPVDTKDVPKKFQLEIVGAISEDRLDKKICPWDAITMHHFDKKSVEHSEYFYEPKNLKLIDGKWVISDEEKKRLEEKQQELIGG